MPLGELCGVPWLRILLRWANESGCALVLHALDALLKFFKESKLFSVARNSAWHCSLFGQNGVDDRHGALTRARHVGLRNLGFNGLLSANA